MQGMITDPRLAREFILAGNATVTFVSGKSGNRFTYRVRKAPHNENPQSVLYFVSLLGQDNEDDYTYLGIIIKTVSAREAFMRFKLTEKSYKNNFCLDSPSVLAMDWVTDHLSQDQMPYLTEIWHMGRCGACGRLLTVPESIATGIGPVCASKGI